MEAVVLRSQDYREKARILTLYSKESGLVSVLVKGIGRRNSCATSPPAHSHFTCKEGKSDLLLATEVTLIHSHVDVRKSYGHIVATKKMLDLMIKTQLPRHPEPALFALLTAYLGTLPLMEHPETLALSFSLKLWKHEGSLEIIPEHFTDEEKQTLHLLLTARHFAPLRELGETESLAEKLSSLAIN